MVALCSGWTQKQVSRGFERPSLPASSSIIIIIIVVIVPLCLLPTCLCVFCQLVCVSVASLSGCLSADLSVCLMPACLSVCLSADLSVCLMSTCLGVCLQTCLCVCCQPVCVSASLSICLSPNLYVCLSASLSVYLSVCRLYVCLPVCLCLLPTCLCVCLRSVCLSANLYIPAANLSVSNHHPRRCTVQARRCRRSTSRPSRRPRCAGAARTWTSCTSPAHASSVMRNSGNSRWRGQCSRSLDWEPREQPLMCSRADRSASSDHHDDDFKETYLPGNRLEKTKVFAYWYAF